MKILHSHLPPTTKLELFKRHLSTALLRNPRFLWQLDGVKQKYCDDLQYCDILLSSNTCTTRWRPVAPGEFPGAQCPPAWWHPEKFLGGGVQVGEVFRQISNFCQENVCVNIDLFHCVTSYFDIFILLATIFQQLTCNFPGYFCEFRGIFVIFMKFL